MLGMLPRAKDSYQGALPLAREVQKRVHKRHTFTSLREPEKTYFAAWCGMGVPQEQLSEEWAKIDCGHCHSKMKRKQLGMR